MKVLIPAIGAVTLITALGALLCGCISITVTTTVGNVETDPENPAISEMQAAGVTNSVGARSNGTVATTCAIYSHKTISPATTASVVPK